MTASNVVKRDAPRPRPAPSKFSWAWLGVMPFFIFAFMFLIYPSSTIAWGSFVDANTGAFTFQNFVHLLQNPVLINAYWISVQISLFTSLGGGIFGFLLAYSAIRGGLPPFMRSSLMTFCGVASNFAGVPLAFAFIALLSPSGVLTGWLMGHGLQSGFPWLPTLHVLGIEYCVYVLPISFDGIGYCTRELTACDENGLRLQKIWEPPVFNTGDTLLCRFSYPLYWAQ